MSQGNKHQFHRERKPPASGRKPSWKLTPGDMETIGDERVTYHRLYHSVFQRREQRSWSMVYLCGQLSDVERQTIEPMVLALKGPEPNVVGAVQQFMGQGQWDIPVFVQRPQQLVAELLGDPRAVVIFDGSGFPKQGQDWAGVARQ